MSALARRMIPGLLLPFILAADPVHAASYEVRADGFRFGLMSVETTTSPGAYGITVSAEAQGLFGFLLQSHYLGTAEGILDPSGRPEPRRFSAKTDRIFKHRDVAVTFQNGRPESVSLTPEKDRTEYTDPSRVTGDRMDSLSYFYRMFTAAAGACAPDGLLYDGRRQTSVTFAPPVVSADATACSGTYAITDGPDHSIQSGQRRFDLSLTYLPAGGSPTGITVISGGHTVTLSRLTP